MSAEKNIRSPEFGWTKSKIFFISSVLRNFFIGELTPDSISLISSILKYANPFAPNFFTASVYRSIYFLVISFPPGTLSATILFFESFTQSLKTLNSVLFNKLVMSFS